MSSLQTILAERFPGAVTESAFLFRTHGALTSEGFTNHNTLPCVGLCRDELGFSLKRGIESRWGEPFSFSSLGGMLTLGRTGFAAATHHAPVEGGRGRLLFFVMPHIAIGSDGVLGRCGRQGQQVGASVACGALRAFQAELESGHLSMKVDFRDVEQSLLKARLVEELPFGSVPDLATITMAAHAIASRDLAALIDEGLDSSRMDYALITGVHIHGSEGADYIWPGEVSVRVRGERREVAFKDDRS